MHKSDLREKYKKLRETLSNELIEDLSLQIANKALELPIWNHTYYHIFLPIAKKKEVNSECILHILQGKDKSIVVPKVNFASGSMTHFLLQENTAFSISKYGISEPVSGIEIPPNQINVVFVPLLAYDKHGNRVGYGKGFYDRFLANCNPESIFIGLSFFEPEEGIISEITDIPLHFCISPLKIYTF